MNKTERKALEWLFGGGTGASSQAMCQFFLLGDAKRCQSWGPSDSGDFGRCMGLLRAVPEWRKRVPELVALGGEWPGLVRHWSTLEALYLKGDWLSFQQKIRAAAARPSRKAPALLRQGDGSR